MNHSNRFRLWLHATVSQNAIIAQPVPRTCCPYALIAEKLRSSRYPVATTAHRSLGKNEALAAPYGTMQRETDTTTAARSLAKAEAFAAMYGTMQYGSRRSRWRSPATGCADAQLHAERLLAAFHDTYSFVRRAWEREAQQREASKPVDDGTVTVLDGPLSDNRPDASPCPQEAAEGIMGYGDTEARIHATLAGSLFTE